MTEWLDLPWFLLDPQRRLFDCLRAEEACERPDSGVCEKCRARNDQGCQLNADTSSVRPDEASAVQQK
jgi:hypothetical protein